MFICERFVLENCFIMTVLTISFSFFDSRIVILGPTTLIFCAWGWAKFSYSLALTPTLLFHITMNSNFHNKLHDHLAILLKMTIVLFCVFYVPFKIPMNSRPLLPRALLLNRWRETSLLVFTPFKERWFLNMHIEQSAEEDEVEGGGKKCLTHIKMWPKITRYLYYSWSSSPFTGSWGMFCCLAPAPQEFNTE